MKARTLHDKEWTAPTAAGAKPHIAFQVSHLDEFLTLRPSMGASFIRPEL
jgi:hypothetical protein